MYSKINDVTEKTKTNLVVISLTVGIAALLYFIFKGSIKKIFDKKNDSSSEQQSQNITITVDTPQGPQQVSAKINLDKVLRKGVYDSDEVAEMQHLLNNYLDKVRTAIYSLAYVPNLAVDGDFGSNTEAVLKAVTGKTSITLRELQTTLVKLLK